MYDEQQAIENLKTIKQMLDHHHIEYWIDEGTLLGAVREKKLIPWDHDIDFSIWSSTLPKLFPLFNEFTSVGYEVCYQIEKKHIKLQKNGEEIDINIYQKENNTASRTWYEHNSLGNILDYLMWTFMIKNPKSRAFHFPLFITKTLIKINNKFPPWLKREKIRWLFKIYEKKGSKKLKMAVPKHFFETFTEIKFYDMTITVPKQTEQYLEYRYGKDWKTPKKDYIYTKDDKSIIRK